MNKRLKNRNHEINAGSMADVAILSLIFFALCTSIVQIDSLSIPFNDEQNVKW